ncbi:formylglycine-generating enzyme family protein [Candidatus Foliamicus sp.]
MTTNNRFILLSVLIAGLAIQVALAQEAAPETFQDCDHCPEMVVVPPGAFVMGSEDAVDERPMGPPRAVRIAQPFALGKYEITNAQYQAFTSATGYEMEPGCRGYIGDEWAMDPEAHWTDLRLGQEWQPEHPVACVSWLDARAYVAWLSETSGQTYRLPSEAEWEYAARAGSGEFYPWGEDPHQGCTYANMYDISTDAVHNFGWPRVNCDDGFSTLAPVGRFQANGFGLHDVTGNLWEWVEDCYEVLYSDAMPVDGSAYGPPPGQCDNRSVRGGSWLTNYPWQRVTFRGRDPETVRYSFFGFRVARSLAESEQE